MRMVCLSTRHAGLRWAEQMMERDHTYQSCPIRAQMIVQLALSWTGMSCRSRGKCSGWTRRQTSTDSKLTWEPLDCFAAARTRKCHNGSPSLPRRMSTGVMKVLKVLAFWAALSSIVLVSTGMHGKQRGSWSGKEIQELLHVKLSRGGLTIWG